MPPSTGNSAHIGTLFIADLHLSAQEPAGTAAFLHLLQNKAVHADGLYILGDLFEVWIGDDDPQPLHTQVATALTSLKQQGVPCYFIHGNRDFLIGQRFAQRCGMILLPQEKVLDLYGRRILILHGDTLCTDDHAYQRFRRLVHQPLIQRLFLWLPLKWRRNIAIAMRHKSQRSGNSKHKTIMDVNGPAVIAALQQHNVSGIIHGHTHRPAIHDIILQKTTAYRYVLGAWHTEGSMINVTADAIELMRFPF